ncbi:MAG: peptidoglycan-associated lipoprotein [Candidatus Zixiibacteriota bacterium]|nr:MAG: peptidoglycan-associated lipoprotein [candidate division Zixibacteria bacterium]
MTKRLIFLLAVGALLMTVLGGCPGSPPPVLKETQFETVHFDLDKFNLRGDAKAALDHNYELLKDFPDVICKIEGHCDERGTIEYNLSLGEKRARAAMDYLIGLGIDASRISIISYGKERPVDPGHNDAAWDKNRRDEFKIISQ